MLTIMMSSSFRGIVVMLDFHSEIPAQVVLSGVMGRFSRRAPLELIAALAAAADGHVTAFDSPTLRSAIRTYVTRSQERGVRIEQIVVRIVGVVEEIAPEWESYRDGTMLLQTVIRLATHYYYADSASQSEDNRGDDEPDRRELSRDVLPFRVATAP